MEKMFTRTTTEPVVQTKYGKLRGYCIDGTYTFHGIKYADADRFQMPREVEPWQGIRDVNSYGFVCPLLDQETPNAEVMVPHRYWPMDEHCQYLNIWTQSLDSAAKKPVMVWLHGGGFFAGSSIEHVAYDGENLSKYGDVVMVSLNHRLNVLGYLDLSPFGEKYANSANAGNADMVAALKWIRDNIAEFGGDPENVTLFGQSGGGMKVWSLMQTPEADGLFHKGIIQSGLIEGMMDHPDEDGTRIVHALLKELGFSEDDVDKLETVPYAMLAEAYQKVAPALEKAGHYVGNAPKPNDFYLGDPRKIGFTEHAKTIPVMIGTVFGEFNFGPGYRGKYNASRDEMVKVLEERYKGKSQKLIELFKQAYPDKCLLDLLELDSIFRCPTIDFIEKKVQHPQSSTYSYLFALEFPLDDGKPSWHCSEIPFVFHNTDKVPVCNIPGVTARLQKQIADAWISFAGDGKPQSEELPEWPACAPGQEAVMVFDKNCEVRYNFDKELIQLHDSVTPEFAMDEADIQH